MEQLAKAKKLVVEYRIVRGWTQHELSEKSGVGYSTITRIETAVAPFPTRRIMQKLAAAFGKHYDPDKIAFVDESPLLKIGTFKGSELQSQAASSGKKAKAADERKKKARE